MTWHHSYLILFLNVVVAVQNGRVCRTVSYWVGRPDEAIHNFKYFPNFTGNCRKRPILELAKYLEDKSFDCWIASSQTCRISNPDENDVGDDAAKANTKRNILGNHWINSWRHLWGFGIPRQTRSLCITVLKMLNYLAHFPTRKHIATKRVTQIHQMRWCATHCSPPDGRI